MTSRQGTGVTHRPATGRGELEYPADIAPGVTVTWDPARPHRCTGVTVADDDREPADVDAAPWLRLAAVAVLDRRLYLPLDPSLLDAEHAAARLTAARTLGTGDPLRELLVRRALVGARGAAQGVVAHLERLTTDRRRPPPPVTAALERLIRCYTSLTAEVRGHDGALTAVVDAGRRLADTPPGPVARGGTVTAPVAPTPARDGVDRIDPRTVPARVLRLGPAWDAAEIGVRPVDGSGDPAVRVRVGAYPSHPGREVDVGARLIDRRSGTVRGYALLGRPGPSDRHLEAVVPLEPAARDVRVELFDAADAPPPAPPDDDELGRVRRATLFLAGWRALVADTRLWGVRAAPANRLREVVRRVSDGAGDGLLWSGGPTRSHLWRLGEHGDRTLTAWLRDGRDPAGATRTADVGIGAVSGPGDLLVAEVLAAHRRSA